MIKFIAGFWLEKLEFLCDDEIVYTTTGTSCAKNFIN